MSTWKLVAFVRLFGAALLGLGLVIWAVRGVSDAATVRRVARSAALASGLVLAIVLIQQLVVWSTRAGMVPAAIFAGFTLLYALASLGGRAAVSAPQGSALEQGGHDLPDRELVE